jgi:hypothetical protein
METDNENQGTAEPTEPVLGSKIEGYEGGAILIEKYRARALAVPEHERAVYRGAPELIRKNVALGTQNVLQESAILKHDLPHLDLQSIEEVLEIGTAFVDCALQVERFYDATGERYRSLLEEATKLRLLFLSCFEIAVLQGLIPETNVAQIRKRRGPRAIALSCDHCAALYETHQAKLVGKSPITKADVKRISQVGVQLLLLIRHKGERKRRHDELVRMAALRDGLLTLMLRGYDLVRRLAGYLFGDERDARTPNAFTTTYGRRRKDPLLVAQAELVEAEERVRLVQEKKAAKAAAKAAVDEAKRLAAEAKRVARDALDNLRNVRAKK